uniref:Uncharacterized protein n=1 Tax=Rhizophora mucronata TaxID=61149 RepID=A0A2P2QSI2_RHIMU
MQFSLGRVIPCKAVRLQGIPCLSYNFLLYICFRNIFTL